MGTAAEDSARTVLIAEGDHGQRIDNFLLRELKGVPRSHVYRLLRSGQVRVNGGRIKPAYRLAAGDRLRLPPVRRAARSEPAALPRQLLAAVEAAVLHEDERLLVLNKPAGVAVHGGSGLGGGVIEALRRLRPDLGGLELAHRLDRDTSGCLLLTKDREWLRRVHQALAAGDIDKRYVALLAGRWGGGPRWLQDSLRKSVPRGGERMVEIASAGKPARSRFVPRRRFADCTLMEVVIATGRTHQIRVQAAACGHPVIGDEKYGDRAVNRRFRRAGLRRMFLHAWRLGLPAALGGQRFEAPLPADLDRLLDRLPGGEA